MAKKKTARKKKLPAVELVEGEARVLKERIKQSGKPSRVKGHVSARTRRSQAKRDVKNA